MENNRLRNYRLRGDDEEGDAPHLPSTITRNKGKDIVGSSSSSTMARPPSNHAIVTDLAFDTDDEIRPFRPYHSQSHFYNLRSLDENIRQSVAATSSAPAIVEDIVGSSASSTVARLPFNHAHTIVSSFGFDDEEENPSFKPRIVSRFGIDTDTDDEESGPFKTPSNQATVPSLGFDTDDEENRPYKPLSNQAIIAMASRLGFAEDEEKLPFKPYHSSHAYFYTDATALFEEIRQTYGC